MIRWTFRCECDYSGDQLKNFLNQVRAEACSDEITGRIVANEGGIAVVAEGTDTEVEGLIDSIIGESGTGNYLTLLIEYEIEKDFTSFWQFSHKLGTKKCGE